MAWDYSDKTVALFKNALNSSPASYRGKIENAEAIGVFGSLECGDAIKFYLKIEYHPTDPALDLIKMARYETFGCTSAIAASEALCAIIEQANLSPLDAMNISNRDIVNYLGGMPPAKVHCSVMGAEVLKNTILDWASRRGYNFKDNLSGSKIPRILERETLSKDFAHKGKSIQQEELSLETKNLIQTTMSELIPPIMSKRNCEFELLAIKGNKVYCKIRPLDPNGFLDLEKLKNTIEKFLREKIDETIVIIDV